ncbi:zinc finger X-chromosomal protein-like [Diaphorina citri]|uniref:Zinc finger X-chromosomal protein-like n=1 Tax=Diaphorina citri TaxID=121845 RepID=A0A3Q0J3S8_DIACI|nr:zinc finger X-chromosomal protein-like [Diaphorina citri]
MPRLHGPKSKYVCWACTSFNTNHLGNVRKHIQRHLGDKPLRCAYCDYRCIQKSQLVIHAYNFHTASLDSLKGSSYIALPLCPDCMPRPDAFRCKFVCYACHSFHTYNGTAMKNHIMVHLEEKPYACQFCDYRCVQKVSLKSHMIRCRKSASNFANMKSHIQTHLGDKPFSCTFCNYRCSRKAHLTRHAYYKHSNCVFRG